MTSASKLPNSCAVAFKEWAGVCDALIAGEQALILRKGGIAEGPAGFVPEHDAFWLYPTRVHQAEQGLRAPERESAPATGLVPIRALAVVELIGFVDRPEALAALEPLHVWTAETVHKRFHYRNPGLFVLGVRVFRAPEPFPIPLTPEHAGCKTWVPLLPPLCTSGLVPVRTESEHARDRARLRAALGTTPLRANE